MQVIWATGISMVILGLLVRLPYKWIFISGVLIVLAHNLMDYPEAAWQHQENFLWHLIHDSRRGVLAYAPGRLIIVFYPFLPWTGAMLLGYAAGKLFEPAFPAIKRKKILVAVGMFAILVFVILRTINGYGDPESARAPDKCCRQNPLFSLPCGNKISAFINVPLYNIRALPYITGIFRKYSGNRVASFFYRIWQGPFFLLPGAFF